MGARDGELGLDFGAIAEPAPVPERAAPLPATPFTWSEQHRHACEVRFFAAMGRDRRESYVLGVEKHRGRAAAERLWNDTKALIASLKNQ